MIVPKKDKLGRYTIRFWRSNDSRPFKLLEKEAGTLTYKQAKEAALTFYNTFEAPPEPDSRPSISQVVNVYLEAGATSLAPSSILETRSYLKNKFLPFWKDRSVEDLTVLDVERYKTFRLSQASRKGGQIKGGSINREVAIFLAAVNRCYELGILKTNPFAGRKIKKFPKVTRLEYFEREEWKRFIEAFSDREQILQDVKKNCRISGSSAEREAYLTNVQKGADLFRVLLLTASRISEILDLRRSAVNFRAGTVSVYQSKTKTSKHLNMTPELRAILERLSLESTDKAGGFIFTRFDGKPFPVVQAENIFRVGMRLSGLKRPFTPHSVRHTSCSWLAIAGVPIQKIQVIAGHKNIASTMIYAHLSPASLDTSLGVLSEEPKSANGVDTPGYVVAAK